VVRRWESWFQLPTLFVNNSKNHKGLIKDMTDNERNVYSRIEILNLKPIPSPDVCSKMVQKNVQQQRSSLA